MVDQRRLLWAVAAAIAVAALTPTALAQADGVSGDDLTLLSAGPDVPYTAL